MKFQLNLKDIKTERVSGKVKAGGQNSNRNYSAIRLTHIPTGLQAYCQDQRSQQQNWQSAFDVLTERVGALYNEARLRKLAELFPPVKETIRTYHFVDNYTKDHRTGKRYDLKEVMDGNLDEIIDDIRKEL